MTGPGNRFNSDRRISLSNVIELLDPLAPKISTKQFDNSYQIGRAHV